MERGGHVVLLNGEEALEVAHLLREADRTTLGMPAKDRLLEWAEYLEAEAPGPELDARRWRENDGRPSIVPYRREELAPSEVIYTPGPSPAALRWFTIMVALVLTAAIAVLYIQEVVVGG